MSAALDGFGDRYVPIPNAGHQVRDGPIHIRKCPAVLIDGSAISPVVSVSGHRLQRLRLPWLPVTRVGCVKDIE
jgi:hypothetical protein